MDFSEGYFYKFYNCRGYISKCDDSETRTKMDYSEGYYKLLFYCCGYIKT
jgi:hypothetical protein